jgi:hypothetical protein
MNAWWCNNKKLGLLIFESNDEDRMDRSMQPIYYQRKTNTGLYSNKLNAFMDHVWDGFYTGQKREQRFPGLIEVDAIDSVNNEIEIVFTGSPAKVMTFEILSNNEIGSKIKIAYPSALSRNLVKDG